MPLAICLRIVVLPAFGRRDDHAALALADRRDHVDDALGHRERARLEPEPLVGEQRRELVEVRPFLRRLGVHVR